MKNILAENLLRFGVKNLSESEKTRLTEIDSTTIVPLIIEVPFQKDAQGTMVLNRNKWVKVTAKNVKGTDSSSLDEVSSLVNLEISGLQTKVQGSKKAPGTGDITAVFSINGAAADDLAKKLQSLVGKTINDNDKSIVSTWMKIPANTGTVSLYNGRTIFKMYDTGAATPVTPK